MFWSAITEEMHYLLLLLMDKFYQSFFEDNRASFILADFDAILIDISYVHLNPNRVSIDCNIGANNIMFHHTPFESYCVNLRYS